MKPNSERTVFLACVLVILIYVLMIDLKGISTDEGIRLAIVNGGNGFSLNNPAISATWGDVLKANNHCAYQPLYFIILNTVLRLAGTYDVVFIRLLNVFFLGVCLRGLISLSHDWKIAPRLIMLCLFSFNAYLFMHVLQIREYIAGIAFYIWSTWLVLKLHRRPLIKPKADIVWFAGYGILLTSGFYLQTWVVFPAIGQLLFMVWQRHSERWRFYKYLCLSYMIVLAASVPYLVTHVQKVNVGSWGSTTSQLLPQLSTGFHLVIAGHQSGQSIISDSLFWFWPGLCMLAVVLCLCKNISTALPENFRFEIKRQSILMLLCSGTSLTFQISYFYGREDLSVWPRYFAIHYFFVIWLISLSVLYIFELRQHIRTSAARFGLTALLGVVATTTVFASTVQIRSYYRDPYLDTGFSRISNWRIWTRELARVVQDGDVVISHDFISRATLTFTHPMGNTVLLLHELETANLMGVDRLVYMESSGSLHEREQLQYRIKTLGFPHWQELKMKTPGENGVSSEWQVLVFSR